MSDTIVRHFYWVSAMALPVLFSKGRSLTTSLSVWTCNMAPGKKQVVNPITPVPQSSLCLATLGLHLKIMPFVLKHILPSASLANFQTHFFSKLLLTQNINTGHVLCLLCHSKDLKSLRFTLLLEK